MTFGNTPSSVLSIELPQTSSETGGPSTLSKVDLSKQPSYNGMVFASHPQSSPASATRSPSDESSLSEEKSQEQEVSSALSSPSHSDEMDQGGLQKKIKTLMQENETLKKEKKVLEEELKDMLHQNMQLRRDLQKSLHPTGSLSNLHQKRTSSSPSLTESSKTLPDAGGNASPPPQNSHVDATPTVNQTAVVEKKQDDQTLVLPVKTIKKAECLRTGYVPIMITTTIGNERLFFNTICRRDTQKKIFRDAEAEVKIEFMSKNFDEVLTKLKKQKKEKRRHQEEGTVRIYGIAEYIEQAKWKDEPTFFTETRGRFNAASSVRTHYAIRSWVPYRRTAGTAFNFSGASPVVFESEESYSYHENLGKKIQREQLREYIRVQGEAERQMLDIMQRKETLDNSLRNPSGFSFFSNRKLVKSQFLAELIKRIKALEKKKETYKTGKKDVNNAITKEEIKEIVNELVSDCISDKNKPGHEQKYWDWNIVQAGRKSETLKLLKELGYDQAEVDQRLKPVVLSNSANVSPVMTRI